VYGEGSRSGADLALLRDSALIDYLEAADNWARVSDEGTTYLLQALAFDAVWAVSSNDGDVKIIGPHDFQLFAEGFWQEP
ncbi:MAG: hypothetical protein ACYTG0_34725, partial [Planctomycetota bacterium]